MDKLLKREEKLAYNLRKLYQQYGYSQFKMSKFEPYDLYADKKDFLVSDGVITFTDTDGTLLALKPDVTLSIIKNYQHAPGLVQKTYYNENVYRTGSSGQGFREIVQTGLECVGQVDEISICEVLLLAVKSLETISENYILDISHMGIPEQLLASMNLNAEQRSMVMACLEEKNEDALQSLPFPIAEIARQQLLTLLRAYGPVEQVLENSPILKELVAYEDLRKLAINLRTLGISDKVNLDFSIIGSRNYYNGLIFRGYVAGIPSGVLSGGQYDKLMKKMGKSAGGIGFAVYLNQLEMLNNTAKDFDCDAILLYDENIPTDRVLTAAETLRKSTDQLLVLRQLPKDLTYRKLFRFRDGKVTEDE